MLFTKGMRNHIFFCPKIYITSLFLNEYLRFNDMINTSIMMNIDLHFNQSE